MKSPRLASRRRMTQPRPDAPQKWLVVHQNSELYGADRVLIEAAAVLTEYADVIVAVPVPGPLVEELTGRGIRCVLVEDLFILRKSLLKPAALPAAIRDSARSYRTMRRLFQDERVTNIYVNTITLPVPVVAGRIAGIRTVVHVHEAETELPWVIRKLLVAPLLLSDEIVAVSTAVFRFVSATWPGLTNRIHIVRNPVRQPAERFTELPPNRPSQLRVIVPGRWSERKGTHLAIAACAEARTLGVPLRLVVVGSVYPGYEWYERQIRTLASRVLDDTEFVPFAAALDDLWALAEVTLMPSRNEGYGLVAAESLARGRVTIASNVDGLTEIISPGRTGLLAEPTAAGFCACIEQVWSDWPSARWMAEQGQAEAVTWTRAAFAADLARVLNLVTASPEQNCRRRDPRAHRRRGR